MANGICMGSGHEECVDVQEVWACRRQKRHTLLFNDHPSLAIEGITSADPPMLSSYSSRETEGRNPI